MITEKIKLYFYVIILISLLLFECLVKFRTCLEKKPIIFFNILLHVLIIELFYLGWIFNNIFVMIFYLLFLIGIVIYWIFNNWKCDLTKIENEECDFPKNTKADYIYRLINDEKIHLIVYISLYFIFLAIIIYKMYKYFNS